MRLVTLTMTRSEFRRRRTRKLVTRLLASGFVLTLRRVR